MNGIDTVVSSLLANRVDSLLNLAAGSATASQTGAAGVDSAPVTVTPLTPLAAPPASAQTALSAVALALNAIINSGGEATPAVLGQVPIWPAAPALDVEAGGLPLFDTPAASSTNPNAAATTATANVMAAQVPVAALAAALEQTVAVSGLFYESHLAQWLAGQRPPAALADEAQNKLVAAATQLPLDWANDADQASSSNAAPRQGTGTGGSPNGPANGAPARAMPSILTAQAALFVAGELLASSLPDLNGQPAHSSAHSAAAQLAGDGSSQNSQSMAAAVHPETIPLVRQQLDLLATGQFRWTGEAWPGAKLDWTIEQEGDEWDRSGGGTASEEDQPWRTRLTLSLPALGTVDADLTLTGSRLVARVQASPAGAARLAMQGESFRQRLAAAGIELNGLTIREIGGGAPASAAGAAGATAQAAASAYARSAAAAAADKVPAGRRDTRAGSPGAAPLDNFDWDM
ncbi:MAG: hypothetical protein QOC89_5006 [Paraburkholderia sp.]|uniref:flagellar hook-length control protein FliK n=1 Tax=Paraburkholderia sp. TaxID=1926495 RepID=UPI002AFE1619|nr:flagellar hook-length control protein FliK [Paraburkholderia sp.]MEA3087309.1 hypothetical protein [Paraburkholderia sp.]